MAKRGISLNPGYRSGSHWAVCDSCGFQFRAEDLRQTWDNHWVCSDDFEVRHPQDFLRVKAEKITVEQPIRPDDLSNAVLEFPSIDSRIGVAVVDYVMVDREYTMLNLDFDTNARSSIAGYAQAGDAIAGLANLTENLGERIPLGTFNPNTL